MPIFGATTPRRFCGSNYHNMLVIPRGIKRQNGSKRVSRRAHKTWYFSAYARWWRRKVA